MSNLHRKRVIQKRARRARVHRRIRSRLKGSVERPRLCVTKSLRYIYAQVIDDRSGRTLAQANSLEKGLRESLNGACGNKQAAQAVGEKVAERSLEQGIKTVVFDRGGYVYHGKIQVLADAAREKGLVF